MLKQLSLFIFFFGFSNLLSSQITFQLAQTGLIPTSSSANVQATSDIDGDGIEEILKVSFSDLLILKQKKIGEPFFLWKTTSGFQGAYSIVVANFDKDPEKEVIVGTSNSAYIVDLEPEIITKKILKEYIFSQSMSVLDLDNDNDLDVFICHDLGKSKPMINDGNGQFIDDPLMFENLFDTDEDNAGNYGTTFSDYDNDGDMDLFIARCNVYNDNFRRRINILYNNNGNGHFSIERNSDTLMVDDQTWAADLGDTDNDGDMDIVVINHDVINKFYRNDNSKYVDISSEVKLGLSTNGWQAKFVDFDNDGLIDIFVAGDEQKIYLNKGNNNFETINFVNNINLTSISMGDYNFDGKIDIHGVQSFGLTSPSETKDEIYFNTTKNENHFIAINVLDSVGVQESIGARVTCYTGNMKQIRDVRAGESYGIQFSGIIHFGIGLNNSVDSLKVHWPDGHEELIKNPKIDYFHSIRKNNCVSESVDIITDSVNGTTKFCEGDTIRASLIPEIGTAWSDGYVGSNRIITDDIQLWAIITSEDGCQGKSSLKQFEKNPVEIVKINPIDKFEFCQGETQTLSISNTFTDLEWNNGEKQNNIEVEISGNYFVKVKGLCDYYNSDTVSLVFRIITPPTTENDTIEKNNSSTLTALGENLKWYADNEKINLLFVGDTFSTPNLVETTNYYVTSTKKYGGLVGLVGLNLSNNPSFGGMNTNGSLIFDALDDIIIDSVTVHTDQSGLRRIIILDKNENIVYEKDILILNGTSRIFFGAQIDKDNDYQLTTDITINQNNLGASSPRLARNNTGVSFPYTLENAISINNSSLGENYYYYFYDMSISKPASSCESLPSEVKVIVESGIGTTKTKTFTKIYSDQKKVYFSIPEIGTAKGIFRDLMGNEIASSKIDLNNQNLNLDIPTKCKNGVFIFSVETQKNTYVEKIIVVD